MNIPKHMDTKKKTSVWKDMGLVFSIFMGIVLVLGIIIYAGSFTVSQTKKDFATIFQQKEKELKEIENNQYNTLSKKLDIDEKNIIISDNYKFNNSYLVKTNNKSYTVIFNENGKEIEKIVEN